MLPSTLCPSFPCHWIQSWSCFMHTLWSAVGMICWNVSISPCKILCKSKQNTYNKRVYQYKSILVEIRGCFFTRYIDDENFIYKSQNIAIPSACQRSRSTSSFLEHQRLQLIPLRPSPWILCFCLHYSHCNWEQVVITISSHGTQQFPP